MFSTRGFKIFFWTFLFLFTLFIILGVYQITYQKKDCICNLDFCDCQNEKESICQNDCIHGKCQESKCICKKGFTGLACDQAISGKSTLKLHNIKHAQEEAKKLTILMYCSSTGQCIKNINNIKSEEFEVLVFGKNLNNLEVKSRRNLFIFKGEYDLISTLRYGSIISSGDNVLFLNSNDKISNEMLNFDFTKNPKSIYHLKKDSNTESLGSIIFNVNFMQLSFDGFTLNKFISSIKHLEISKDDKAHNHLFDEEMNKLTFYYEKGLSIKENNIIKIKEYNQEDLTSEKENLILLITERSLNQIPDHQIENICTVILYENDGERLYEDRYKIEKSINLIFTTKKIVLNRFHIFQRRVFQINEVSDIIDPSIFYCNLKFSKQNQKLPLVFPDLQISYPMHIGLQVDHFDFPGGLERVVTEVAMNLKSKGFKVTLLNLGRVGPPQNDIIKLGFNVVSLGNEKDKIIEYKNNLIKGQFHIINAHYSTFGHDICKDLSIPFIQTIHNEYTWLNQEEIARFKEADKNTYAYFCVSSTAAFYSDLKLGLNVQKMILIRNGVDEERFNIEKNCPKENRRAIRKELGISKDDFTFLQVGSLVPIKAPQFSIQAMKQVIQENPNVKLFIIGKGMDREYPRKLQISILQNQLMGNVKILGHRTDVPCLLSAMDALLHPSILEGWCLAIAEAVYLNKPVIVCDTGGSKDFVGKYGVKNSIVLKPPYQSILTANINHLANIEQPEYVNRIANAINNLVKEPKLKPLKRKDVEDLLKSNYIYQVYGKLFQFIHLGKSIESLKDLTRMNYE